MNTYSQMPSRVKTLISKYGRDVQLISKTNSGTSYNPTISEKPVIVKAVVFDIKESTIGGTITKQGDKKFMVYTDKAIDQSMSIKDIGETYQIVDIEITKPGDTLLVYSILGRK